MLTSDRLLPFRGVPLTSSTYQTSTLGLAGKAKGPGLGRFRVALLPVNLPFSGPQGVLEMKSWPKLKAPAQQQQLVDHYCLLL
jgi:hypothetical protein